MSDYKLASLMIDGMAGACTIVNNEPFVVDGIPCAGLFYRPFHKMAALLIPAQFNQPIMPEPYPSDIIVPPVMHLLALAKTKSGYAGQGHVYITYIRPRVDINQLCEWIMTGRVE